MRDKIRANLKIFVMLTISLAIISYAYFETAQVLRGPVIEIGNPTNGYSSTESAVEITGKVKNVSYMFMNGRPIFADSSGNFKEGVILSPGYNSIYIEATDRIGKTKFEMLEMVYVEKDSHLAKESIAKESFPPLTP
jgi:uncharacterized protein YfaP (DUF2135 family)